VFHPGQYFELLARWDILVPNKAAGLLSVFAIHLVSSPFVAKSLRLLDTVCGIIFTTKK
jgi:hypothetical protein